MPPKKKSVKKNAGTKRPSRNTNLPAKKKTGSRTLPVKRKSGSNPSALETRGIGRLERSEETGTDYSEMRQVLMGESERPAQLISPKQSKWGWLEFGSMFAFFLLGIPLIIYSVYHWTKHRQA